jgi:disease resistance protein RPS2
MKGARSRQSTYDEGHTMLNKLENVCLLERFIYDNGVRAVKMHDLIRDMAIQIQQENSQGMVKAGAQIRVAGCRGVDGEFYESFTNRKSN